MINFSTLQGLTIPEGVVTQITDAAGNVLWSSTITFTINGDTYVADRSMTWAEWFASSHNTTGKTANDVSTITDSNGNTVNLTDIIVNGTAYEVGFSPATATITLNGKGNGWYHYVKHNRTIYSNATNTPSFQANIGDVIVCHCMLTGGEMSIYLNGILVAGKTGGTMAVDYSYTVVSDATIELAQSDEYRRIIITEVPEGQITFTIDSTTYFAQENMTWAEWFASSYNTTGKTANDVQSISANGTAVALDAIIVGGMAYDIVFAEMVTVTITGAGNANYCYILIDGVSYATATSLAVPVGTTITAFVAGRECDCGRDGGQNTIRINDLYYYTSPKDYTVEKNVTINLFYESDDCKDCDDSWRDCFIQIIET